MSKFKSVIIILGSLVIFIVASLATFLGLSYAGAIVTDPINLTYVIQDEVKQYDGTPLTANECYLVSGELINGHDVYFEFHGSQTNVGESKSDVRIKVLDENKFDVTKNYSIKVEQGSLTVNKAPISIKVEDCSVVYSGDEIYFDNYTIIEGDLAQGHQIKAKTFQEGSIEVGIQDLELDPMIYDIAGNDVTANYDVDFAVGKLEILPRNLDIKPRDYSKVYDGEDLVCNEYEVLGGSLVYGHFLEAKYETSNGSLAKISNVSQSTRTKIAEYKIYTYVGEEKVDVTKNYKVNTISEGVFEIKPRSLVLTGEQKVFTYNGKEQSLKDVNTVLHSDGLVFGDKVTVKYADTVKVNVTSEPVKVKIESYEISSGNQNYNVELVDGSISIIKEDLTIYYATIDETYSGVAMKKKSEDFISTISCSVSGVKVSIKDTDLKAALDKYIDAGNYSYIFDNKQIDITLGSDIVNDNFNILFVAGNINIRKQYVDVSLNNLTAEYTGNDFTIDASKVFTSNTKDIKVTISAEALKSVFKDIKNAGVYTYSIPINSLSVVNSTNNKSLDKKNLDIKINTGTIVITKKELKIVLDSYENLTYDGNAPKMSGNGFTSTGQITGKTVSIPTLSKLIQKYKNAGTYVYTITPEEVFVGDELATNNYYVVIEAGKIVIAKKKLTVKLNSYENLTYSGNAPTMTGNGFTSEGEITGETITIPALTKIVSQYKNAGTYIYTVNPEDVLAGVKPATENYVVVIETGKIVIAKKQLTVTLDSYNESYTGNPIQMKGNGFTASGQVSGDVTIKTLKNTINEFIEPGTYTYTVNPEDVLVDGKLATDNYFVSVNTAVVVIKQLYGSVTAHVENLYVFTKDSFDQNLYGNLNSLLVIDSFVPANAGDKLDYSQINISLVGYSVVATGNLMVTDANGKDVTDNYSIVFIDTAQVIFMIPE